MTPVLWPDFGERDLLLAVAEYQSRERRYGDVHSGAETGGPAPVDGAADPGTWKRLLKVRP